MKRRQIIHNKNYVKLTFHLIQENIKEKEKRKRKAVWQMQAVLL